MKRIFLSCLTAFLLVSTATYAADLGVNKGVEKPVHHVHAHAKSVSTQPVDINHADATQLSTLKGVGAKKAAAIVAYRQAHGAFASVDDLSKVKGIGLKMLARLQKNNPNRITINNAKNIG